MAFEAGWAPREALFLFPNLFEFWFIAVAFAMRFRPSFAWTTRRTAIALGVLLVAKLAQEWALHVGQVFDGTSFLGAIDTIGHAVLAPLGIR